MAQFVCTTAASDIACTNSGTAAVFTNDTALANQNATTTNAGTANGFTSQTGGGGNATTTNSGTNLSGDITAVTTNGGDATASNSGDAGNNGGNVQAVTQGGGNATATNSGTAGGAVEAVTQAGGNATVTNSGTARGGVEAVTTGGGSATATNAGANVGLQAVTSGGGNATAMNSGLNAGGVQAVTQTGGNATTTNSGGNTGGINSVTQGGGNATANNSGSNADGIQAVTQSGGNATVNNSGSNTNANDFGIQAVSSGAGNAAINNSGGTSNVLAVAPGSGNAILNNSGRVTADNIASPGAPAVVLSATGGGNATANNSGQVAANFLGTPALVLTATGGGSSTLTNTGVISGVIADANNPIIQFVGGPDTMTNVVGSRVIGFINLVGTPGIQDTVNFVGGNWLFTFNTLAQATIITHGAPFVVVNNGNGSSTVAVLDPTVFALADRALMNFTGDVAQMLQGRFDGMPVAGAGRAAAMSFAPAASGSALTDEVQAAFSGIPSVAMSYASDARRPLIGKASPAGEPYYDTTIWASGFGGERKQRVDGSVLPATDTAYGGALGIDRAFGPNLRLGGFLGGGASRESVELSVQSVDATYIFGGVYGRFDWVAQYLDFALYGGSIKISNSTIGFADNLVPTGFVNATAANSGGWFISPELTYGYRIPFNAVTVTPRVRLRYLGASLDGLNESFAGQNLSVARRAINDLEERGEVEVSTVSGAFKGTASIGVIGLERLGNPIVNTVLLTQNLSFATPGQNNAVGGVFGLGLQYQPLPNVKLFVAGEGTAMSDKSDSFAASGGAQLSF